MILINRALRCLMIYCDAFNMIKALQDLGVGDAQLACEAKTGDTEPLGAMMQCRWAENCLINIFPNVKVKLQSYKHTRPHLPGECCEMS